MGFYLQCGWFWWILLPQHGNWMISIRMTIQSYFTRWRISVWELDFSIPSNRHPITIQSAWQRGTDIYSCDSQWHEKNDLNRKRNETSLTWRSNRWVSRDHVDLLEKYLHVLFALSGPRKHLELQLNKDIPDTKIMIFGVEKIFFTPRFVTGYNTKVLFADNISQRVNNGRSWGPRRRLYSRSFDRWNTKLSFSWWNSSRS